MLWPREEFDAAYGQIKREGIVYGGCSILILVALDVDALCACEILTNLFKADCLSYSLVAVKGFEDIQRVARERIRNDQDEIVSNDLRSIVMVNCGAIVNVMQLLRLPEEVKCYILDSHRPIHLTNIYDPRQQIIVFDDEAQSPEEYPVDGSDIEEDHLEDSEEDDDQSDEDDEEDAAEDRDDDAEQKKRKQDEDESDGEAEVQFDSVVSKQDRKEPTDSQDDQDKENQPLSSSSNMAKRPFEEAFDDQEQSGSSKSKRKAVASDSGEEHSAVDSDDDDDDDHDHDGDESDAGSRKSINVKSTEQVEPTKKQQRMLEKQAKRQRREEILKYYRGSFYGAPASTIAFQLARQMNLCTKDVVWCAIVGLTKQFLAEEIDRDNYNMCIQTFQDEILSMDISNPTEEMVSEEGIRLPSMEHGKISFEEEYRFMLHRHWSLYESLYYSNYVASKLGLWNSQHGSVMALTLEPTSNGGGGGRSYQQGLFNAQEAANGQEQLNMFLARMGLSLKQALQKFSYMSIENRRQLKQKIVEIAPEFGLEELLYGSFQRKFAFNYELGAADAVFGIRALLEAPASLVYSVFCNQSVMQNSMSNPAANLGASSSSAAALFESFFASEGSGMQKPGMTAAEIVQRTDNGQRVNDTSGDGNAQADTGDSEIPEGSDQLNRFWQRNFLLAHAALSCQSVASSSLLESGIKVAMEIKKKLVQVGLSIIDRRLIVRVKHFRYVCLDVAEKDLELFANAAILSQLALFLIDVHRANGKWLRDSLKKKKTRTKRDGDEPAQGEEQQDEDDDDGEEEEENESLHTRPIVPLILITKNPIEKSFLVIGATCPRQSGEIHRNTLGTAFRLAAGETGASFRQDGFETAVMEIQMEDVHYFVEQLHNVLDA